MALKIVRNDITQMNVEAIVNTANRYPMVGTDVIRRSTMRRDMKNCWHTGKNRSVR